MTARSLGTTWRSAGIDLEPAGRLIRAVAKPSPADRTAARLRWCAVRADWQRRREALRAEAEALPGSLGWWAAWLLDALAESSEPVAVGVVDDPPGAAIVRISRVELVGGDLAAAVDGVGGRDDVAAAVAWLGRRMQGEDAAFGCWVMRRTRRLDEQRRRDDAVVGSDGVGVDPDGDPTRPHGVIVGDAYVRM